MNFSIKIFFLSTLLVFLSCGHKSQETELANDDESQDKTINKKSIESLRYSEYVLDSKAQKELSSWQKYSELQRVLNDVKNANMAFFKDNHDVLKSFLDDLKSTTPEIVNTPAILSRIKIIETMSYKLEDELMLSHPKQDKILESIKEFLQACSNLNFQINKKFERDSQRIQRP